MLPWLIAPIGVGIAILAVLAVRCGGAAGHTSFVVNDATGSGAGWNVTVSATTFATGAKSLANSGTLQITGSSSAESATTAPDAVCNSGSTCTLSLNGTTYRMRRGRPQIRGRAPS